MPLADAQPKPNPVIQWMRSQVARIPEGENTFSILNMARGGANTALNWLDATNRALQGYDPRGALEQGDVLAPLGIAAMGAPFAVRGALGSAGGRLTPGATRQGTEAVVDRSAGSALPNQQLSRRTAGDPQGHTPASSAGPEGQGARSSMTSAQSSGASDDLIRRLYEERQPLPPGWYVHGRSGQEALRDDAVIQMTRDYDTAEFYGGSGSGWALTPASGARVLDFGEGSSSRDLRRVAQLMMADYRKGTLPSSIEAMLPPNPGVNDFFRAAAEFAPNRIVESAGAFDDVSAVNWLWEKAGADFVRTPDGAVALHPDAVRQVRLWADHSRSSLPGAVINADQDRRRIFLMPLGAPQFKR